MKSTHTSKNVSHGRNYLLGLICCLLAPAVTPLCAEPVEDRFVDTTFVESKEDTAILRIIDDKLVVTARETAPGEWGKYGNRAVFGWNLPGAKPHEGFSLNPDDRQFILKVGDMESYMPSGATQSPEIYVYIYFYKVGNPDLLPESEYLAAYDFPQSGSWSFNVRDYAIQKFGSEKGLPADIVWRPEFYIATHNQPEVGFSFQSIAATDSE